MRARSLIGVAATVKQSQVSPLRRVLSLFPLIPTVLYAEQLNSLRDMGMLDFERNVTVLVSVDGDMNLAVERLMS